MTCITLIVSSCTTISGRMLRTGPIDDTVSLSGDYTLFIIGGTHGEDVKNISVLDLEGDDIEFQPYVSEYDYSKIEHLSGQEAMREALHGVSWYHAFWRTKIKGILDSEGKIIAYEIRPLFSPLQFGISDILDTDYVLHDNRVFVYLRFKPSIEKSRQRRMKYDDD